MGEETPKPEDKPQVVMMPAPSGKITPMMILVMAQFLVLVGIGVWALTSFNQSSDDKEADPADKIIITKEAYDALQAQKAQAATDALQNAPTTPALAGRLHIASSLPMGVGGKQALLQWHSDGVDYFALSGVMIVEGRDESEATFVFPGSEPIILGEGDTLPMRNRMLRVERIREREVLLSDQGQLYTAKLTNAGSHSVISGVSLRQGNNVQIVPDPAKAGDGAEVDKPRDVRDLTGLPDAATQPTKTAGAAEPEEPQEYQPIVWSTPQPQWEAKWLHIVDLFDTHALLVAAMNKQGNFIGVKIAAFHKAPEGDADDKQDGGDKIGPLEELEGFGFAIGDIILQVQDSTVSEPLEFFKVLKATRYHSGVSFTMLRNGRTQMVYFDLDEN